MAKKKKSSSKGKMTEKEFRETALKPATQRMSTLFRNKDLDNPGRSKATAEGERKYYTEISAEYLLSHLDLFDDIKPIVRKDKSYDAKHDGTIPDKATKAERKKISLYNRVIGDLGKCIDYMVPLKNPRAGGSGVGKIDLLCQSLDGSTLYTVEYKHKDQDSDKEAVDYLEDEDTLLRCFLQTYTHWRILRADTMGEKTGAAKLLRDLEHLFIKDASGAPIVPSKIIPAVLIGKNSKQEEVFCNGKHPLTVELIDRMGVEVFALDNNDVAHRL